MGRRKPTSGRVGEPKRLPAFASDEEAEAFLEQDLADYITAETLVPLSDVVSFGRSDPLKASSRPKRRRKRD